MKNYENLTNKLLKLRKVRDIIFKYRYAIISATVLAVATTSTLCGITGIVTDKGKVNKTYEYGQPVNIQPNAIMSDCYIEFSKNGTDKWTKNVPTKVGTYDTRVVSKTAGNKDKVSKYATFDIVPKKIIVSVDTRNDVFKYGDLPSIINEELAYGDELKAGNVVLEDYTALKTKAYVDTKSIHINNKLGEDVSDCYTFETQKKDINIVKRPISVNLTGGDKYYDGEAFDTTQTEVTYGSLAYGDKIVTYDDSKAILPGEYINGYERNSSIKIFNKDNVDVSSLYNISSSAEDIYIHKIPLKIKSATVVRDYNGKLPEPDEINKFDVLEGLLPNHEIKATFGTRGNEYILPTSTGEALPNDFTFSVVEKDNPSNDVTKYYDIPTDREMWGTIQTKPIDLFVETGSKTIEYDGKSHTLPTPTSIEGLIPTDNFIVKESTMVENAVEKAENNIVYEIVNDKHEVVNRAYNVKVKTGSLSVLKKNIDIDIKDTTQNPTTKFYDGKQLDLTNDNLSYLQDSLAPEDFVFIDEANTDSGITKAGTKKVNYQVKICNEDKTEDLTKNYNINYLNKSVAEPNKGNAELTVKKRNVNVALNKGSLKELQYTGQDLSDDLITDYEITGESGSISDGSGLVAGEKLDLSFKPTANKIVNVGEYNISDKNLLDFKVTEENNPTNNTTSCYNFTVQEAVATIRPIVLEIDNVFTKTYDDKPFKIHVDNNNKDDELPKIRIKNVEVEDIGDLNQRLDYFNKNFTLSFDAEAKRSADDYYLEASDQLYNATVTNLKVTKISSSKVDISKNFEIKYFDGENYHYLPINSQEPEPINDVFKLKINKRKLTIEPNIVDGFYKEELSKTTIGNVKGLANEKHKISGSFTSHFRGEIDSKPGIYSGFNVIDPSSIKISKDGVEGYEKNYEIECIDGQVKIKKSDITIETRGYTKVYDGDYISNYPFEQLEINPTLRAGHYIDLQSAFELTREGLKSDYFEAIPNTLKKYNVADPRTGELGYTPGPNHNVYAIRDKTHNEFVYDLDYFYNIEVKVNNISIQKNKITIEGFKLETDYDGEAHILKFDIGQKITKDSNNIFVKKGEIPNGFTFELSRSIELNETAVGTYKVTGNPSYSIEECIFVSADYSIATHANQDEDALLSNFEFTFGDLGLKISERNLKVTYFTEMTMEKENFVVEEFKPIVSIVRGLVSTHTYHSVGYDYVKFSYEVREDEVVYTINKNDFHIFDAYGNDVTNQYNIQGFEPNMQGDDVITITVTLI